MVGSLLIEASIPGADPFTPRDYPAELAASSTGPTQSVQQPR